MKIDELLSQKGLVQASPGAEVVRTRAENNNPQPTELFYGETYDTYGHPIDSLKYYLFVSSLADSIIEEGFDSTPKILVADTAACRNVSEGLESKFMRLGEERRELVENVNDIYETGLEIIKMSDYIHSPEFKERVERIMNFAKQHEEIMDMVERSVPESHRTEERRKGFRYSFDEISTIIDLDFKVGPPRESLYDDAARKIAEIKNDKKLHSIFLTPTFPLGKSWAYFFKHDGIENYGITAYKAGSKGLQDNRIIIGDTNPEYVENLIEKSFISTNRDLPNPVLDIGIIAEMAKQRIEGEDRPITLYNDFYGGSMTKDELKNTVSADVKEYILKPFKEVY